MVGAVDHSAGAYIRERYFPEIVLRTMRGGEDKRRAPEFTSVNEDARNRSLTQISAKRKQMVLDLFSVRSRKANDEHRSLLP